MSRHSRNRAALAISRSAILWISAALFSIPLYLMVTLSLKTPKEIAFAPFALPTDPQWANFAEAWQKSAGSAAPTLGASMVNSALLTTISVVLVLGISAPAAYFLGRSESRFARTTYLAFVVAITVPIQLVIIPVYGAMDSLGVLGSTFATSLFYVGFLTPFAVFLMTGFVRAIPRDFEEAARLDGANQWTTFRLVILPLLRPILSTVAILTGVAVWNDFFGQLVFLLGSGNETLPLSVYSFASQFASRYDLLAAGLVIATIPLVVFYLLLQRRIVEGFASGIKG